MFNWPLDRNVIRRGSERNTFGPVRRDVNGNPRNHQGWDFEAVNGTPAYAIADGHVAVTTGDTGDYGRVIVIGFEHEGRTLFAAYAHMSRIDVQVGVKVKRGQRIGLTGSSGNAQGMGPLDQHLHFEIRTVPMPGRGLEGRMSPLKIFGKCPLNEAVAGGLVV